LNGLFIIYMILEDWRPASARKDVKQSLGSQPWL